MYSRPNYQAPRGVVGGERGTEHDGDLTQKPGPRYDRSQISFFSSRSRPLSAFSEHDVESNAGLYSKEEVPDLGVKDDTQVFCLFIIEFGNVHATHE